ncbi:hypothetical protein MXMO3_00152 [Maritalea myrionectae]|uniref:C-type lysozyme inhibitor domain-containing protein n=1 Tax=Maritalea myrionectae TaxID=454601 RepID=A0A2R4M9K4_9HYPH|nr:hypothetical protein [Maritalea myrionectae]AVX02700.1 hypothetical protein MXMO3_00152 [Maritalea myrionectae]
MHRLTSISAKIGVAIFSILLLVHGAAAARILTIEKNPASIELQSAFINGQRVEIVAQADQYAFIELEDGAQCYATLSLIAENGRFLRKQLNLCDAEWQVALNFGDTGAGPSVRTITIVPSQDNVRILALSFDGEPQPFTAFPNSNRVEFDIRRGPSGFKCVGELSAALSGADDFERTVDLCSFGNEVILDVEPTRYYEILTVRSGGDDKIIDIKLNGEELNIIRHIGNDARTRVFADNSGINCTGNLEVEFASGATGQGQLDLCGSNFDVTITPKPQYASDTNLRAGYTWRFNAPKSEEDIASLEFKARSFNRTGFSAVCEPGSRRATIYLDGFPARANLPRRTRINWTTGRYNGVVNGDRGQSPLASGPAPSFSKSTDDRLWKGLISGANFTGIANDNHRLTLSLNGSAGPVREFLQACNTRFNGPSVYGDVTDDSSLKWSTPPSRRDGDLRLVFGDVTTDRIGLEARCTPQEDVVRIMFASAPRGLTSGRNVNVQWRVGDDNGRVRATTRTVEGYDWGALPVAAIDTRDPMWRALALGNIVRWSINDEQTATYSLKGSGAAIRRFLNGCRPPSQPDIGDGGDSDFGVDPDRPTTGNEAVDTIINIFDLINQQSDSNVNINITTQSAAARQALNNYRADPNYMCGLSASSQPMGNRAVSIGFKNDRGRPVEVYEIAGNGQRQYVRDVPPNARLQLTRNAGQGFEVRSPNGGCLTTMVATNADIEYRINPSMGGADPDVVAKSYNCSGREVVALIEPNKGTALVDGQYALHRARVNGSFANVWGNVRAKITNQELVLEEGGTTRLSCRAR